MHLTFRPRPLRPVASGLPASGRPFTYNVRTQWPLGSLSLCAYSLPFLGSQIRVTRSAKSDLTGSRESSGRLCSLHRPQAKRF